MAFLLVEHTISAQNNRRTGERAVLIKYIHPLVSAGFNVLALDQRNHGQSDYAPPVTFGWYESRDIPTMIDWLLGMVFCFQPLSSHPKR